MRVRDARLVNAIINHPTVRPTAQGGGYELDATELVRDRRNVVYASESGAVVFKYLAPGLFEGHIFCPSWSRGREALNLGHSALKALFERPGTLKLVADVPMRLSAARFLCRKLGLQPQFRDLADIALDVERFEMEKYNGRYC